MFTELRRAALLSLASLGVLLCICGWLMARDVVLCGRTVHATTEPRDWRRWDVVGAEATYRADARGPLATSEWLALGPPMCPFEGASMPIPAALSTVSSTAAEIDFPHWPADWRLRAAPSRAAFLLTSSVDGPERPVNAYTVIAAPRLALRSNEALRDLAIALVGAALAFAATAGAGRRARRAAALANAQMYIEGNRHESGAIEAASLGVPLAVPAPSVSGQAGPVLLRVKVDPTLAYRKAPSATVLEIVRGARADVVTRFHRQTMMRLRVPPIALALVLLFVTPWSAIANAASRTAHPSAPAVTAT